MDVLIVFGSRTDAVTYEKIAASLKELKLSYSARVCSAHKSFEALRELISSTEAKVIIAGAGLSAALPGVVAAQTSKPVIGVPCFGAYDGLDSFLATHQMPPGIPVLGVGVNATKEATLNAKKILESKEKIVIVKSDDNEGIEKISKAINKFLANEFGIETEIIYATEVKEDSKTIFINITNLWNANSLANENLLVINVPVATPNLAEQAIMLMNKVRQGLWMGVNRAENAAIAAVQILNLHQNLEEKLKAYRAKIREKVLEDDKTESERLGKI